VSSSAELVDRAGGFVAFAGVFRAAGVLSEPTASVGPGVELPAGRAGDFRGAGGFSPDRASLIFAIGGESGGGATVERVSDRPGAEEEAGRAPPSTEDTPDPEPGDAAVRAGDAPVRPVAAPDLGPAACAPGRAAAPDPVEAAPAPAVCAPELAEGASGPVDWGRAEGDLPGTVSEPVGADEIAADWALALPLAVAGASS
jgi:hypothetical protein